MKKYLVPALIALFLFSFMYFDQVLLEPAPSPSPISQGDDPSCPHPSAQSPSPPESTTPAVQPAPLSTTKEGWGFVPSKDEKPPGITAHQQKSMTDFDVLYMGKPEQKAVTLTFDMGYEKEGLTPKILDTLKSHGIKGTFFLTGHYLKTQPEIVQRMAAEGHTIGNHTWNHKSMPTLSKETFTEEILSYEKKVEEMTGQKTRYLRPPMGEYSNQTLAWTKEMGYITTFWSIAMKDWVPMKDPTDAVRGVVNHLHPGAVVLLHGNSEDVANKLEEIIQGIKAKGYEIVPIDQIR